MHKEYSVDLHGLTTQQAKKRLQQLLNTLPDDAGQLTVIHGFHAGNTLQQTIRGNGFRHWRIRQKVLSLNPGETILLLHPRTKKQPSKNG